MPSISDLIDFGVDFGTLDKELIKAKLAVAADALGDIAVHVASKTKSPIDDLAAVQLKQYLKEYFNPTPVPVGPVTRSVSAEAEKPGGPIIDALLPVVITALIEWLRKRKG